MVMTLRQRRSHDTVELQHRYQTLDQPVMKQRYGVIEFALSFIIVATVFFSLAVVYKKHHRGVKMGMILHAEFDAADGLNTGSPVKINGVIVGSIKSIALNPQTFSAIVTFSVRRDLRLPKDTMAAVTSEGLLTGKAMSLIPGSEDAILSEKDTIYRTTSAMNFEDLLHKFLFNSAGDGEGKNNDRRENKDEKSEEQRGDGTVSNSLPGAKIPTNNMIIGNITSLMRIPCE